MSDTATQSTTLATAVFDALPLPVLIHSESEIVAVNRAAVRLLAADSAFELLGHPITRIVHPDGREAGEARRKLLFEADHQFPAVPVKLITSSGDPLPVTISATSFTFGSRRFAVTAACPNGCDDVRIPGMAATPGAAPDSLEAAALDSLPFPTLGVCERSVAFANRALHAMVLAGEDGDLVGTPALDLLHPEARPAMEERVGLLQQMGGTPIRLPLKTLSRSGECRRPMCNAGSIRHAGRNVFLFVITDLDT